MDFNSSNAYFHRLVVAFVIKTNLTKGLICIVNLLLWKIMNVLIVTRRGMYWKVAMLLKKDQKYKNFGEKDSNKNNTKKLFDKPKVKLEELDANYVESLK